MQNSTPIQSVSQERLFEKLNHHPVFESAESANWLDSWMKAEVFALFAEANLAHSLVAKILRWDSIWVPTQNAEVARLTVELAQEYELGKSFDVFVLAMKESGVSTQPIFRFMNAIREECSLEEALASVSHSDPWISEMVKTYFRLSERSTEIMAGALFWGQSEEFLNSIQIKLKHFNQLTPTLAHFFELRSAELRSGEVFLKSLCGQSDRRWKEVHQGADSLVFARELFFDGILSQMSAAPPAQLN